MFDDRDFDDVDLPLLHERAYHVRSYRTPDGAMLLRGTVRDEKPPGLFIASDPDPLVIHHMVIDVTVDTRTLLITGADVVMEVHPHATCPRIIDHYDELIGISISRGYVSKVRELFGGPRGCAHLTALLLAMGPVVVQSFWSLRQDVVQLDAPRRLSTQERRAAAEMNIGSCHVWAEGAELTEHVRAGDQTPMPIWAATRMRELGVDPSQWGGGVRE